MKDTTYGPEFLWWAWRPTKTQDRGWRWMKYVWKRRVWTHSDMYDGDYFETSVEGF